jgi:DNA replication and repair protein RecF
MQNLKLSRISTKNFRNLQMDIVEFGPGINCILGENGHGKTNLLEAIYFIINRKSFRKKTGFTQILSMDVEKPEIFLSSAFRTENNDEFSFSGKVKANEYEWYLNGKISKKKIDSEIIFINPFDSHSFHHLPVFRREWIDRHLCLLDSKYRSSLSQYQKLIKQRNTLLLQKPFHWRELIESFHENFVILTQVILEKRHEFCQNLNQFISPTFKAIFSEEHSFEMQISSHFHSKNQAEISKLIKDNFSKDAEAGITLKGVHRDDYQLLFDGFLSYEYCSLGQQKMGFLALLFAYIELFRYKFSTYPIVLIDDVSGELDRRRWKNLINYLSEKNFQVLITTANEEFRKELELIKGIKKIRVSTGIVENFH